MESFPAKKVDFGTGRQDGEVDEMGRDAEPVDKAANRARREIGETRESILGMLLCKVESIDSCAVDPCVHLTILTYFAISVVFFFPSHAWS